MLWVVGTVCRAAVDGYRVYREVKVLKGFYDCV
jgi:hypothetical protein